MGELQEGSGMTAGCGCTAAGGRVYELLKMTSPERQARGVQLWT